MKITFLIFTLAFSTLCLGQVSQSDYLSENRQDLIVNPTIEIGASKIIGFGALHGSSKTEDTEILLVQSLVNNQGLEYYFPETDFSTANYFQEYIGTGDEQLLEELIKEYKKRVPQEGSIEVFEKWKKLRPLFLENNVKVIGIDKIASYKFSVKEIIELTNEIENQYIDSLNILLKAQNTNWTAYYPTKSRSTIENFVSNFEENERDYLQSISDTLSFKHIIQNLKQTFEESSRVETYYNNYEKANQWYNLKNSLQFFRFGVFHIMKSRINNSPSLFVKLIENKMYAANEILSIQGFLTQGKVLWDLKYDKQGQYSGYITKAGYGISDYWLEYYKGIKWLKKKALSEITLFDLTSTSSPYKREDEYELVKIRKLIGNSFWNPEQGKSTTDYIDFAILISNSKENTPIEELKE